MGNFAVKMLCVFNFCRLAKSVSSTEVLKHKFFGQLVLQIIPPQHWEAVASYIPLQILFESLGIFLTRRMVRIYNIHIHTDDIFMLAAFV